MSFNLFRRRSRRALVAVAARPLVNPRAVGRAGRCVGVPGHGIRGKRSAGAPGKVGMCRGWFAHDHLQKGAAALYVWCGAPPVMGGEGAAATVLGPVGPPIARLGAVGSQPTCCPGGGCGDQLLPSSGSSTAPGLRLLEQVGAVTPPNETSQRKSKQGEEHDEHRLKGAMAPPGARTRTRREQTEETSPEKSSGGRA